MADDTSFGSFNNFNIFGYEIKKKDDKGKKNLKSIVAPTDEDGAGYVTAAGHFGHYVDLDGMAGVKDNIQQIQKYRQMATHPELDGAIEEIVNEAIISSETEATVTLNLDDVKVGENVKKKITTEFEKIYNMLNFSDNGHDIFRSWYVDGRIYHHLLIDETKPKEGIQEIRFIDALKIRKVKNIKKKKDPNSGVAFIKEVEEYYLFQESAAINATSIKLSSDCVSYVTSGLLDETKRRVVSYLHKAIKPLNQLRMMEDSLVIYRLARAPERRLFYIDVGNLPPKKAAAYMQQIQAKYRNKLTYDASTGQLKDDRKHMSMLEDFWLPRKEGGRGTEISTLPGGDNLGQIDDIVYFQKKLWRCLNVPLQRLEQETQFSLGRSNEITRDEVKFQKFIDRLRNRFSKLFVNILKKQLVLMNIMTEEDWNTYKGSIHVEYQRDNYFSELKDLEIKREKFQSLDMVDQYSGKYYSKEWIQKNVLNLTDEEIKEIEKQIAKENPEIPDDAGDLDQQQQGGAPGQQQAAPAPQPAAPNLPKSKPMKIEKTKNEDFLQEAELSLIENLSAFISS